jgi:aspartyl-tRNA(Asn)/glutamyl-tRNA(Gln) amidotransferase subunit B
MSSQRAGVGDGTAWEMVVGLEVHVQLRTETKAFCRCRTTFGDPPNTNVCPVCLGLPGALPVLNARAVEYAVRAALALNCTVHRRSVFARKNYFYPDLPKGYQISQFDRPLATNGALHVAAQHGTRRIGITRVHMEEDAGKSIHDRFASATAIDLNRSGVPLIEIVSEPDMRSPEEAGAYLRLLKQILEYTDVSDVSMEEGSLRVDANVSIRPFGQVSLGTKTEVKNMNSFSSVERALAAEYARQVALREAGADVEQVTLLYDATRNAVRPARAKEESHDYRYFPDPDLPPLVIDHASIEKARAALPILPPERRKKFQESFAIGEADANVLTATRALADYYESVASESGDPRAAAHWVMGEVLAIANAAKIDLRAIDLSPPVDPRRLGALINLVKSGAVSGSAGKQIFLEMRTSGEEPSAIARRLNLLQVGDDVQLAEWIDEVFADNPVEAARFLGGDRKLQGVLVGLVMRKSQGRADPRKLNQLLAARLTG